MSCNTLFAVFAKQFYHKHLLSPVWQKSRLGTVPLMCQYFCSKSPRKWQFSDLEPYGKLVVSRNSSQPVSFKVTPLNPHDHPSQNKASVTLRGGIWEDGSLAGEILKCTAEKGVIRVSQGDENNVTSAKTQNTGEPLECDIEIPLKYDCDVTLEAYNNISLSEFENQDVDIRVQHGECRLKNVKTGNIQISSDSGPLISESLLQGNVFIQSERGSISLHKPLSQTLTIQTHEGDVHIQNLYSDRTNITTHHSNVHIGSCHRNANVDINYQGNLKIDSVDGSLSAKIKSGNADVFVSQHEWVNITTGRGDITVKVSDSSRSTLEAKGDDILIDKKLRLDNRTDETSDDLKKIVKGMLTGDADANKVSTAPIGHISVQTGSGNISIKCQDWLSSLKLKGLKS